VTAYPSSTTLTVTRGQEGTAASAHNTEGKTYMLLATVTAKTFNADIPALVNYTGEVDFQDTGWLTNVLSADIGTLSVDTLNVTTLTVTEEIDGVAITNAPYVTAAIVQVNDDAYAVGWDGSTNVPTKNAVYDKIELLSTKADPTFTGTAVIPTASIATATIGSGAVTNNIGAIMAAPAAAAVVDLTFASRILTLDGALTITHATNGVADRELTQTLYIRAGGENRALTIPTGWTTNLYSAKPANITNGWTTKMYVTSIGATADAASQTNVFVNFEFYKNQ